MIGGKVEESDARYARFSVSYAGNQGDIPKDESDEDKAKAIEISGLPKIPVLLYPAGSFLREPSSPLLSEKREKLDLI